MTIIAPEPRPAAASGPPDSSHPHSRDRQDTIHEEEVRLLYSNAPLVLLLTFLNVLILLLVQRTVVAPSILLSWVGYMLVVTVARLALSYAFLHHSESDQDFRR